MEEEEKLFARDLKNRVFELASVFFLQVLT